MHQEPVRAMARPLDFGPKPGKQCLMVQLYLKFQSRRPGSFGTSSAGRFAEWITTTWLRFTCLLFVIALCSTISILPNIPISQKLTLVLASPIAAIFYWYFFLLCLLVCRYLGTFGKVLAHVLIVYFYLFSRFVVQKPPIVTLSLAKP
jgi:hypothetical protein